MVVRASEQIPPSPSPTVGASEEARQEVIWHDLECGRYSADLPLWRALARRMGEGGHCRILEIGAGTGRVALDLAAAGHHVTALELDRALLAALRGRAGRLDLELVHADARSFELSRRDFDLCVVPMQTIQLLGGPAGRLEFLRRARAHLRRGGLLACAIVTHLESYDRARGDLAPSAESMNVGALRYLSRAIRVSLHRRTVLIERERLVVCAPDRGGRAAGEARDVACGDPELGAEERAPERSVIELDRVGVKRLEREAVEVGLHPEPALEVPCTEEYTGSFVVMLVA